MGLDGGLYRRLVELQTLEESEDDPSRADVGRAVLRPPP